MFFLMALKHTSFHNFSGEKNLRDHLYIMVEENNGCNKIKHSHWKLEISTKERRKCREKAHLSLNVLFHTLKYLCKPPQG